MHMTIPVTTSRTASAMAAFISSELSMISRMWSIEESEREKKKGFQQVLCGSFLLIFAVV